MDFDLDAWAKLAKTDPAEFERRRELVLRQMIDRAPPAFRERLEELQRRLDRERKGSAFPLELHTRTNTVMWAGFFRLRKELAAEPSSQRPDNAAPHMAKVIPLRGSRRGTRPGP